jgi:hypothetical protein
MLLVKLEVAQVLKIYPPLMELETSITCSQELTIDLYPEPDKSSRNHSAYFSFAQNYFPTNLLLILLLFYFYAELTRFCLR